MQRFARASDGPLKYTAEEPKSLSFGSPSGLNGIDVLPTTLKSKCRPTISSEYREFSVDAKELPVGLYITGVGDAGSFMVTPARPHIPPPWYAPDG